jgi:hypothetical protein
MGDGFYSVLVTLLLQVNCPGTASADVLQGKFPIDQLVEQSIDIVGPTILIIQVVSMLPTIDDK